jgi:cyclic-di-GMP phosphodiesterase TipF (flagellum assembly factor)
VSARVAERPPAQSQPGDLLRITTDVVRQEAARQDALRQEVRQEIRQELRQDMARQVGQVERELATLERRVDGAIERTRSTTEPLTAEVGELGTLIRQLAETLSDHERKLTEIELAEIERAEVTHARLKPVAPPAPPAPPVVPPIVETVSLPPPPEAPAPAPAAFVPSPAPKVTAGDAMAATIRSAIDANRVDLYLQPMVTLPQRKVRYYEALSRLRSDKGDVVLATDFLGPADSHGLMPKIDNLVIFRCVQVVRRLLSKNREIGLFCNISGSTLTDGSVFPQLLEFLEANRAICSSIVLELPQSALLSAGPIELESLSALAERGYRFSLDNVTNLRFEPRDLLARGFRYVKVRADVLQGSRSQHRSGRPPTCPPLDRSHRRADRERRSARVGVRFGLASCSRRRGGREARVSEPQPPYALPPTGAPSRRGPATPPPSGLSRSHTGWPRRSSMDGCSCP